MLRHFVFDTNALISAHIKRDSVSARAFDKALAMGIMVVSNATLHEFATRFARKKFDKYLSPEDRVEAILHLSEVSICINPIIDIKACKDRDDDKFLSLAIATGAVCLVTGDGRLKDLSPFRGIPIVSPADFLKIF
jgi:putative PIN family toxin of toxin-antitoxin system